MKTAKILEVLPGDAGLLPTSDKAIFEIISPNPSAAITEPRIVKYTRYFRETPVMIPNNPASVSQYNFPRSISIPKPGPEKTPGM
jgi:hypothetical protein